MRHEAGRIKATRYDSEFYYQPNPSGGVIQEWYDVATVWAEVKGISGRELIAAGAEMSGYISYVGTLPL